MRSLLEPVGKGIHLILRLRDGIHLILRRLRNRHDGLRHPLRHLRRLPGGTGERRGGSGHRPRRLLNRLRNRPDIFDHLVALPRHLRKFIPGLRRHRHPQIARRHFAQSRKEHRHRRLDVVQQIVAASTRKEKDECPGGQGSFDDPVVYRSTPRFFLHRSLHRPLFILQDEHHKLLVRLKSRPLTVRQRLRPLPGTHKLLDLGASGQVCLPRLFFIFNDGKIVQTILLRVMIP